MTSRLLTPWGARPARARLVRGHDPRCEPTGILDWTHPAVLALIETLTGDGDPPLTLLRRAHHVLVRDLAAVYAVRERQPASRTLRKRRGSCSQRLAALEAIARGTGVATRVHGFLLDGRFWYARAGRLRRLVPDHVVLAWPEFLVDGEWRSVSELYGDLETLARSSDGQGFTNRTGETLFEAVQRTAVDWHGSTRDCATDCDLSGVVLADLGRFPSRDALFAVHGETVCAPARPVADLLLSRWRVRTHE